MAGLVNYGSSDEEDAVNKEAGGGLPKKFLDTIKSANFQSGSANAVNSKKQLNGKGPFDQVHNNPRQQEPGAPLIGPVQGPTIPADSPLYELLESNEEIAPQSPYSANRALLRNLTLPTIPNYDIPPSPPGSPIANTNARFKQFLDLKRQGVHFNDKLAKSAALKNPSLMQKLMDFSGIDEASQYATTLPKDLWNPDGFPEYAYKEELLKSQQTILKKKEEEKLRGPRESVDFVPSTVSGEPLSRSGTPGLGLRSGQKSAVERVMAGLERGSVELTTGSRGQEEI